MTSIDCAETVSDLKGFPDDFLFGERSSLPLSADRSNMIHPSKNDLFICSQLKMEEGWASSSLPTPPRSPDSANDLEEDLQDHFENLIGEAEALDLLEGMEFDLSPLVEDIMANAGWNACLPGQDLAAQGGAQNQEVRHDCMWSGKCDVSCKQRFRYLSENSDIQLLTPASSPLRTSGIAPVCVSNLPTDSSVVIEFVNPSAVMSYTPHADHSYYQHQHEADQHNVDVMAIPQLIVATPANRNRSKSLWSEYDLSDLQSGIIKEKMLRGLASMKACNGSEGSESDILEDDEEIDVVSLHSLHALQAACAAPPAAPVAPVSSVQTPPARAHETNLSAQQAVQDRSVSKKKKVAPCRQRKQQKAAAVPTCTPATPYLLTPVQSPQSANPVGPIEYPMPKVTSSGRVVQPTNRSASFLEAQPQHSTRGGESSRRKRKTDSAPTSSAKVSRVAGASTRASEVEDPEKRREHNSMERKRRDDLRSAFQRLRELVPDIQSNQKAAKVVILSSAADYLRRLQNDQQSLEAQKRLTAERNKRLQQTLSILRQQRPYQHPHQHQQQQQQQHQQQQSRSSRLGLSLARSVPV